MKSKATTSIFFLLTIFFSFTQKTTAQVKLTIKDKREIIKQILQKTNFSNALEYVPEGTLFLSTENIPVEIQNDFPVIESVKFQFITPEEISKASVAVRRFAFDEFKMKRKSVEVEFVEHNLPSIDGRTFLCRKVKDKWRIKVIKFSFGMV